MKILGSSSSSSGSFVELFVFALISSGLSLSALAQTANDDEVIEEIVVTGFKGSLRMSLDMKRSETVSSMRYSPRILQTFRT